MPTRHRRRVALLLATVVLVAAAVVVLLATGADDTSGPRRLAPGRGATDSTVDPLGYDPGRRADFEARAAAGLAHVLYEKSPGGALATARRVAAWRPLVEAAARAAHQDPNVLEAIVFLESAGRVDVRASDDLRSAVGLTQILAQTATGLLGLHVDVAAAERLTRRIATARSAGARATLVARRRRVDQRFDPRAALAATTRYLAFARSKLGRDDLAIVSYHMGVGNLQRALSAYGRADVPYAQLFFDSTPLRHAAAWRILAGLGDDSSTYLWRIDAARQIMALFRRDPTALAARARLQAGPTAEKVLRPPGRTPRFADARALRTPALALVEGAGLRPSLALAQAPAGERALRGPALVLLRDLALGVRDIAHTAPLVVTSATRDVADEDPGNLGIEAAPSLHTTGYAFDLSRDYRTPAQAQALQFWLDRLTALDLIAWTREPDVIHVTVGPRADALR
jgi:hypothetical protein